MEIETEIGQLVVYEGKAIGQGGFGYVFKGFHKGNKNEELAIKRQERGNTRDDTIEREVENMKQAGGHPNILQFIDVESNMYFALLGVTFSNTQFTPSL